MTTGARDYVWKHSKQKGGNRLMLIAIAEYANEDGYAYPSVDTLAERTSVTVRTAQRQLDRLEASGELKIFNRTDPECPARHYSNLYKIHLPGKEDAKPPDIAGVIKARIMAGGSDSGVITLMTAASLGNDIPVTRVMTAASSDPLFEVVHKQEQETVTPLAAKVVSAAKPRRPSEWQEIVGMCMDIWKCPSGRAAKYAQMIQNRALSGIWQASNISPPMSVREFKGWHHWLVQSGRKLLPNADWLQESVLDFRTCSAYQDAIRDANDPPPVVEPVAVVPSPERAQFARDAIHRLANQKTLTPGVNMTLLPAATRQAVTYARQ